MKIAIVAPLVSAIREPQGGGSQAFVSDLAKGLTGRGHEVDVYAATGSQIGAVTVIDTGVDPASLAPTLYRADGASPRDPAPAELAFASTYAAVRKHSYDVIHNHAFDGPAMSLATGLTASVVHTLHLPPDPTIAAALRQAAATGQPPAVACVSACQAAAWREVAQVDAILPPYVPTRSVPWSETAGRGAVFAGRLSPEKGAVEAIGIAQTAGIRIDVYGDAYDERYARERIDPGVAHQRWACIKAYRGKLCGRSWPVRRSFSARPGGTSRSAWLPPTLRRAGRLLSRSIVAGLAR